MYLGSSNQGVHRALFVADADCLDDTLAPPHDVRSATSGADIPRGYGVDLRSAGREDDDGGIKAEIFEES